MGDAAPFYTLHGIDIAKDKPGISTMKGTTKDLEEWKNSLIKKTYEGEKRRFKFTSATCEVIALVKQIAGHAGKEACALRIAERLLQKEQGAQKKVGHLVDIQRGALFQILTEHDGKPAYLLAKIEHEEFLDEFDMTKHSGLPFNKQIYKMCFITFDEGNDVVDVLVSDNKRKKISEYWSNDFLEVLELTTNEHNTLVAFNTVEAYVNRLKKKHRADHIQIRNGLVAYFRTTATFSFAEMIERVVGDYEPDDDTLDMGLFRAGLENLPSKLTGENIFEQTFDIVKSEITARFKKSINLSDKMTLNFKEDVPNLETVILAVEFDGKKGIRIETEQGYEYFKKIKPANAPA